MDRNVEVLSFRQWRHPMPFSYDEVEERDESEELGRKESKESLDYIDIGAGME